MEGEVKIQIDHAKFDDDGRWDGLKGFVTNSKLNNRSIVENHGNLWHIEKAFRMSKTDLRIRPIYHRLRNRIEAHICISFTAYSIYKELERVLDQEKSSLSLKKAAELTGIMIDHPSAKQICLPGTHSKSITVQSKLPRGKPTRH